MYAGVSKQKLPTCGDNVSERSVAAGDFCSVCLGHLDKCKTAAVDNQTEKRGSQVM